MASCCSFVGRLRISNTLLLRWFAQDVERMYPRIEPAHGLALAPITRALVSFAERPGRDFSGKNPLRVGAQVRFDLFEQFRESLAGQRLIAALAQLAIFISVKFKLVTL